MPESALPASTQSMSPSSSRCACSRAASRSRHAARLEDRHPSPLGLERRAGGAHRAVDIRSGRGRNLSQVLSGGRIDRREASALGRFLPLAADVEPARREVQLRSDHGCLRRRRSVHSFAVRRIRVRSGPYGFPRRRKSIDLLTNSPRNLVDRSGPTRIPRFSFTVGRISRRHTNPTSDFRRSKSMFHVGLRCPNPTCGLPFPLSPAPPRASRFVSAG